MSTMLCDDGLLKVEHEEALGVNQTEISIIWTFIVAFPHYNFPQRES